MFLLQHSAFGIQHSRGPLTGLRGSDDSLALKTRETPADAHRSPAESLAMPDRRPIDIVVGEACDAPAPHARPYVGILFECCGVYERVYRDPQSDHYQGRCPRCLREIRLRVGPGGTSARQFRAS